MAGVSHGFDKFVVIHNDFFEWSVVGGKHNEACRRGGDPKQGVNLCVNENDMHCEINSLSDRRL